MVTDTWCFDKLNFVPPDNSRQRTCEHTYEQLNSSQYATVKETFTFVERDVCFFLQLIERFIY